ncbi:hypothetical protein DMX02_20340 [Pseudomonas jessenii]|nr:hypothetical protein DMX02_20340 [Pseudomonas jessenii]
MAIRRWRCIATVSPGGEFVAKVRYYGRRYIARQNHKSNVGVSLLAIAVYQTTSLSFDSPHSRAGSLPQVF